MKRDELLLSIRTVIATESNEGMRMQEVFQNETLRPILKLQNDLLIDLVKHSPVFIKSGFVSKDAHQKKEIVSSILSKDQRTKTEIISVVVALMTADERSAYRLHAPEYRRRILTMAKERLIDQMVG